MCLSLNYVEKIHVVCELNGELPKPDIGDWTNDFVAFDPLRRHGVTKVEFGNVPFVTVEPTTSDFGTRFR